MLLWVTVTPQTPLKECSVTPDLASKLSVRSGSAALPLLRGSLENEEGPALAGFAILVVSQVHTHNSMGRIVLMLIRRTEGQVRVILGCSKRCISSLGIGIFPLENTFDLCLKAYSWLCSLGIYFRS